MNSTRCSFPYITNIRILSKNKSLSFIPKIPNQPDQDKSIEVHMDQTPIKIKKFKHLKQLPSPIRGDLSFRNFFNKNQMQLHPHFQKEYSSVLFNYYKLHRNIMNKKHSLNNSFVKADKLLQNKLILNKLNKSSVHNYDESFNESSKIVTLIQNKYIKSKLLFIS